MKKIKQIQSKFFNDIIDKGWSKKIIDKLYEKNLDATKFEWFLMKLRNYFMNNEYWKLVKSLDENTIDEIISDMEVENTKSQELYSEKEEQTLWMFNEMKFKEVKEGDKVEVQIMRSGKWQHPMYGEVKVDEETLNDVVKNFEEDKRGIDLAIDENHEPNHKALGWIRGLTQKGKDGLFATIELTKRGAELISEGAYKYFSPEIIFNKKDEETGKVIKNLLVGGAFTNRPFFKAMKPLMASEGNLTDEEFNKSILFFNTNSSMKTILDLLMKFTEGTLSTENKVLLKTKFSELPDEDKTEELTKAVDEATVETEEKVDEVKVDIKEEEKVDEVKKEEFTESKDEITVKMSESEFEIMKNLAKQAKDLIEEKRKFSITEKTTALQFSEKNTKGVILPKTTNEVVEFALGLSEVQVTKFFSLVEKFTKVNAGELGNEEEGEGYNEDQVKFFTEKMSMTKEAALEAIKTLK